MRTSGAYVVLSVFAVKCETLWWLASLKSATRREQEIVDC